MMLASRSLLSVHSLEVERLAFGLIEDFIVVTCDTDVSPGVFMLCSAMSCERRRTQASASQRAKVE